MTTSRRVGWIETWWSEPAPATRKRSRIWCTRSVTRYWASLMASGEGCTATEPIAVDGATGLIGVDGCNVVAVTTAGRGYWIQLYASGDEAWLSSTYDRAWFEEVLAAVQLHPQDAVD